MVGEWRAFQDSLGVFEELMNRVIDPESEHTFSDASQNCGEAAKFYLATSPWTTTERREKENPQTLQMIRRAEEVMVGRYNLPYYLTLQHSCGISEGGARELQKIRDQKKLPSRGPMIGRPQGDEHGGRLYLDEWWNHRQDRCGNGLETYQNMDAMASKSDNLPSCKPVPNIHRVCLLQ